MSRIARLNRNDLTSQLSGMRKRQKDKIFGTMEEQTGFTEEMICETDSEETEGPEELEKEPRPVVSRGTVHASAIIPESDDEQEAEVEFGTSQHQGVLNAQDDRANAQRAGVASDKQSQSTGVGEQQTVNFMEEFRQLREESERSELQRVTIAEPDEDELAISLDHEVGTFQDSQKSIQEPTLTQELRRDLLDSPRTPTQTVYQN